MTLAESASRADSKAAPPLRARPPSAMVRLHALASRPLSVASLAPGAGQASGRDPGFARARDLECAQDVTRPTSAGLRAERTRPGRPRAGEPRRGKAGWGRGGGGERPQRTPVPEEAVFRLAKIGLPTKGTADRPSDEGQRGGGAREALHVLGPLLKLPFCCGFQFLERKETRKKSFKNRNLA